MLAGALLCSPKCAADETAENANTLAMLMQNASMLSDDVTSLADLKSAASDDLPSPATGASSDDAAKEEASVDDVEISTLPAIQSGRFTLPPLRAPSLSTSKIGNGSVPEGFRNDSPASLIALPESPMERPELATAVT
ncbi:MAG: hypothetical protein AAFP90_24440, partial [Planctomycetota bacterium]